MRTTSAASSISSLSGFVLAPLTGRTPDSLAALQDRFATRVHSNRSAARRRRAAEPRTASGATALLIITATNEFVTRPSPAHWGSTTLLGCAVEIDDGVLHGPRQGTLTYREGKVRRLREWLDAEGEALDGAWFYSDSHNDLPLLEVVANPVAVDPDPTLAASGRERGWPVISLRG
jgi:phosphoserine phosphatase